MRPHRGCLGALVFSLILYLRKDQQKSRTCRFTDCLALVQSLAGSKEERNRVVVLQMYNTAVFRASQFQKKKEDRTGHKSETGTHNTAAEMHCGIFDTKN